MNRRTLVIVVPVALTLSFAHLAHADWRDAVNQLMSKTQQTSTTSNSSLSTGTVEKGLKEALRIASQRAVDTLSKQGGFLDDASVHIAPPSPLDKLAPALRAAGFSKQVDNFEQSINRAAEKAAPQAASILADTVSNITFKDARAIYSGGDHAATDYLQEKAGNRLAQLFKPSIANSLSQTGATAKYQLVASQAAKLPVVGQRVNTDLADYVTRKALDGLFAKLANEEAAIRENPTARTTELLKELWGR